MQSLVTRLSSKANKAHTLRQTCSLPKRYRDPHLFENANCRARHVLAANTARIQQTAMCLCLAGGTARALARHSIAVAQLKPGAVALEAHISLLGQRGLMTTECALPMRKAPIHPLRPARAHRPYSAVLCCDSLDAQRHLSSGKQSICMSCWPSHTGEP